MTTQFKKNHKKRGHMSNNHNSIRKHRKHPGVTENTRRMHYHRILFGKYYPRYFKKVGMHYFHKLCNKFFCPIININKLWSLVPQEVKDKASKDNALLIDVMQFEYFKILGISLLPADHLVVVKMKLVSKNVEKKIKEVGGAVVLTT